MQNNTSSMSEKWQAKKDVTIVRSTNIIIGTANDTKLSIAKWVHRMHVTKTEIQKIR